MVKIFIDPGHGGADAGAVSYGLQEKNLTLSIGLKLRSLLLNNYKGVQVMMSRASDKTVSLKNRTNMANKWGADYLLSIHINAGKGTGFESYIYSGSYRSKKQSNKLRGFIHQAVINETGLTNRGQKAANLHMVRESKMNSVLTENGFIDNKSDANKLKNDAFLSKVARGHAKGLAKAFSLKKKGTSSSSSSKSKGYHTIKKGDTLYSIAQKENTTVKKLQQLNPGVVSEKLQIGQKIKLPSKTKPKMYTIKEGDTLYSIAKKYGMTVAHLKKLNPKINANALQIGSKIKIS